MVWSMFGISFSARIKNKIAGLLRHIVIYAYLYWDLFIVVFLSSLLSSYLIYFNFVKWTGSNQSRPWWNWQSYQDWEITGHVPKFGDFLDASKSFEMNLKRKTIDFTKETNIVKLEKSKLIVFNKPAFNEEIPYPLPEGKCGGKCSVSYDRDLLNRADAVLFHFGNLMNETELPKRRHPDQLYVWTNQESPSSLYRIYKEDLQRFNNTFNLTMTYRRDSDIYFPYFDTADIIKEIKNDSLVSNTVNLMAQKSKLIAWISGNCYTKGALFRLQMILEFVDLGLDVDLYGFCVFNSLPGTWRDTHKYLTPYKFYFAMENSLHCRDYITEKTWWNSLRAGVVPVIWGPTREDVEKSLPPGSFIFMEDFSSPQKLIDYLMYLDTHADEYMAYFKWRADSKIAEANPEKAFCQLCRLLHNDDIFETKNNVRPQYKVESIHSWWYYDETKTCITPFTTRERLWGTFYWNMVLSEYRIRFLTQRCFYYAVFIFIIAILVLRRIVLRKTTKNSRPF